MGDEMKQEKSGLLGFSWLEIGLVLVAALGLFWYFSPSGPPSLEDYVASKKGRVSVLKSGNISFGDTVANCRNAPIVLDDSFEDHAAAWPQTGFIIVNRKYMDPLPKNQQLFTFYHECGHMSGIKAEMKADCYGIKAGVKQGWLDQKGLDKLCEFWRPKKGTKVHPPGKVRCKNMIRCFKQAQTEQAL